jgi:hypothetical protein
LCLLAAALAGTAADGSPLFCYCWSPNYAAAQRVFEQAQASYDPNAVAAVLHQFPYHVDSLLAMNELYRSMGEAQVGSTAARGEGCTPVLGQYHISALLCASFSAPAGLGPALGNVPCACCLCSTAAGLHLLCTCLRMSCAAVYHTCPLMLMALIP